jgi:hypothetical protein
MRPTAPWVALLLGFICSPTLAQSGPLAYEGDGDFGSSSYQSGLDPAWGVTPTTTSSGPSFMRPRSFGAFDLGVPVLLNVDHDLLRPGVDLHAQGGVDLGYVAFFVHGGWRWFPVDFDRATSAGNAQYSGNGREPLKNPYFGLGVRVQVPNQSRVLPYASGSFDFNFWNFNETGVACATGYYSWWCTDYNVYRFTPGFSGRVGAAVEVRNGLYIDLGVNVSMTFQGDFFEENQVWVEPFLGVMQRI